MKTNRMKKNLAFAVFLVLASQPALAVECGNPALSSKAIYDFPGAGYWMQSAGNCRMTYTSVGGISSQMYNLCQRKVEPITNNIDAFPVPGGTGDDLYVHPSSVGVRFYKFSEALSSHGQNSPFFSDENHRGNYESIGLLNRGSGQDRTIRIAMGNQSGRVKDYKITKNGNDYQITPLQSAPVDVCKNLPSQGLDGETPIISRDGRMISGIDYSTRKMNIYKLSMPAGTCQKLATIPQETSKVNFSFDNKSVLYRIQDPNTNKGRLMQLDITSGKSKTISGPSEDVQYMSYKPDGTILYARRQTGTSNGTQGMRGEESDLIMVDPNSVAPKADEKPFQAIGMMWAAACNQDIDLDYAAAVGERLNKSVCDSVLNQQSLSSLEPDYRSLSLGRLKSVCGSSDANSGRHSDSHGNGSTQ